MHGQQAHLDERVCRPLRALQALVHVQHEVVVVHPPQLQQQAEGA